MTSNTSSLEEEVKSIADYLGCNGDELWSEMEKLLTKHTIEVVQSFVKDFQTVAIPEVNDYANGWNDCRKRVRANLNEAAGLDYSKLYSNLPNALDLKAQLERG